jgi:ABC-type polysaccharide/polyol phosphate transport system ATPase subunit
VNGHSVALNAQHFRRQFGQLGYQQDTLAAPAAAQRTRRDSEPAQQEKLSFTAPNTEAVVVLGKDDTGRSTVVLIINRSKR